MIFFSSINWLIAILNEDSSTAAICVLFQCAEETSKVIILALIELIDKQNYVDF